jgi:hypothetical protein
LNIFSAPDPSEIFTIKLSDTGEHYCFGRHVKTHGKGFC